MLIINEHFYPDYDALLSKENACSLTTTSWLNGANLNISTNNYILCVMGSYRNEKSVGECNDLKIHNSLNDHTCFCLKFSRLRFQSAINEFHGPVLHEKLKVAQLITKST